MKNVYSNDWFTVYEQNSFFSIIESDYVVFSIKHNDKFLFIHEYRQAYKRCILNIPCGGIMKNESPAEALQQEFNEEIVNYTQLKSTSFDIPVDHDFSCIISPNRYFGKAYFFAVNVSSKFAMSRPHSWMSFHEYNSLFTDSHPMPTILALLNHNNNAL